MNITIQIITLSKLFNFDIANEFNLIGCYNDRTESLAVAERNKPSVILLDYEMEQSNTEIFIQSLLMESPNSKVILLGENLADQDVLNCFMLTHGYMEWKSLGKFLNKAIRSVGLQNEGWFSRRMIGLFIEKLRG